MNILLLTENSWKEIYMLYAQLPQPTSYRILEIQMSTRILIVDDSRAIRELIKMTVADYAETVGECEDGADALGCYEATRPDWVLMDWEMRTDGLTATRRIIKAHPEARILIVTHHDDDNLRMSALEAGAKGLVLKDDLFALSYFLEKH